MQKWQINLKNQGKCKAKISCKDNLYANNKGNLEADYFVAGQNMERDRAKSAKTTIKYTINSVMCP